jgi:uncharacterized protein YbaR (Trm112 family)
MLGKDYLDTLRCPMDPEREARLEETDSTLVCQRCRLTFAIKEGLPALLVEEAALPPGCESSGELPCQKAATPSAAGEKSS